MSYTIIQGDNIDTLKQYPDNYFDSIVTDPPYGIAFLGKDWDNNTGAVETWQECLRVLKPGGYLLAFSAARTYHHLATNIEGVGFEIRDQLMWLYSSGFPKAQDIGKAIQKRQGVEETKPSKGMNAYPEESYKNFNRGVNPGNLSKKDYPDKKAEVIPTSPEALQWAGWKTALKPGHEPIVMARKPFKGSTIDNVLKHGTGALNIDASRIPFDSDCKLVKSYSKRNGQLPMEQYDGKQDKQYDKTVDTFNEQGRYPSNVIGEVKDYEKYFYSPKVSRAERHTGFEIDDLDLPDMSRPRDKDGNIAKDGESNWMVNKKKDPLAHIPTKVTSNGKFVDTTTHPTDPNITPQVGNNHPTVKPVELMKYLIKLVTPPKGTVLDPFTGSGSTGMAAVELGYDFIGCELDPHYVDIANRRIEGWNKPVNNYYDLFEDE